jgi:NAD(P)-dependent dehydrogenase (short-subunit alcohol dehydrogenase family)
MDNLSLPTIELAPNCLADQIILITGASSGIGRALALQAAKYGATTILIGKTLKKLESLYDQIVQAGYPEPAIHPLNLRSAEPKHALELAQSIHSLFGRLDAVVHNAGMSGQIAPLEHLPPHVWQEVIQVNLNAPFLLTHALLPLLKESKYASILFTTPDESHHPKAYWGAYSASKKGLLGLAKTLHLELEDNTTIRVNCINPGCVRTALRVNAYPGIDPNTMPLPESIIPFYIYLLSNQANHIRGKWIGTQP